MEEKSTKKTRETIKEDETWKVMVVVVDHVDDEDDDYNLQRVEYV